VVVPPPCACVVACGRAARLIALRAAGFLPQALPRAHGGTTRCAGRAQLVTSATRRQARFWDVTKGVCIRVCQAESGALNRRTPRPRLSAPDLERLNRIIKAAPVRSSASLSRGRRFSAAGRRLVVGAGCGVA
jgi:hypothetical protein